MQKIFTNLFLPVFIFLSMLIFTSCSKDSKDEPTTPGETESTTLVVSSLAFGHVETESGYAITVTPGSVPPNQNGQSADVTFSIEAGVESPAAMMNGATVQGSIVRLGPEGFNFRWPIKTTYPYPENANPDELYLAHFDELEGSWKLVPKSEFDITSKTISGDALELGYYSVVRMSGSLGKTTADWSDGGFEYTGEPGYYYTLTVAAASNFKYPNQVSWYGGSIVGSTGSSGSYPTGGPKQPTHIHLPQATYQIWISRTKPGTLFEMPKLETYTVASQGTISRPVTYSGPLSTGDGWTLLESPGGGSWVEGGPQGWPAPTSTYGTGEFQATLTWVNTDSKITDLDLHLFGPNDLHVYWSSPAGSAFELDRDWIDDIGHATENVYSTSTIPSGQYNVYVNLYSKHAGSGSTSYTARIIYNGQVTSKNGSIDQENSNDSDVSKMQKVYTFNK